MFRSKKWMVPWVALVVFSACSLSKLSWRGDIPWNAAEKRYPLSPELAVELSRAVLDELDWPIATLDHSRGRILAKVQSLPFYYQVGLFTQRQYYLELLFAEDGLGVTVISPSFFIVKEKLFKKSSHSVLREKDFINPTSLSYRTFRAFFSKLDKKVSLQVAALADPR